MLKRKNSKKEIIEICDNFICAVKENPHVFDALRNVAHTANTITPPQSRYINISLVGIICAKIGLYLGLH